MPKNKVKSLKSKVESRNKKHQTNFDWQFLVAIIAVFFLLLLIAWGAGYYNQQIIKKHVAAAAAIVYNGEDGRTALDILKDKAQVTTEIFEDGSYVNTVNGVKNDRNYYWVFYINGQLGQMPPDQYITKTGDKIEWRYEKFN